MKKLLIGTANPNKAREIAQILDGIPLELHTLAEFENVPEVIEDGATFEANALKKARAYAEAFQMTALADDSGLVVDYLNGAPGVHSARFAGPGASDTMLIEKLLRLMQDAPAEKRTAHFHCTLALVTPEGGQKIIEGTVEGTIALASSGKRGFGYDPVFYYPPLGKTFAELTAEEKNNVSHRARALAKLKKTLYEGAVILSGAKNDNKNSSPFHSPFTQTGHCIS